MATHSKWLVVPHLLCVTLMPSNPDLPVPFVTLSCALWYEEQDGQKQRGTDVRTTLHVRRRPNGQNTLIRRPLCFFSAMVRIHTRLIRPRGTSTIQIAKTRSRMLKSCPLTSRLRDPLRPRTALPSVTSNISMHLQMLTSVTLLQLPEL